MRTTCMTDVANYFRVRWCRHPFFCCCHIEGPGGKVHSRVRQELSALPWRKRPHSGLKSFRNVNIRWYCVAVWICTLEGGLSSWSKFIIQCIPDFQGRVVWHCSLKLYIQCMSESGLVLWSEYTIQCMPDFWERVVWHCSLNLHIQNLTNSFSLHMNIKPQLNICALLNYID